MILSDLVRHAGHPSGIPSAGFMRTTLILLPFLLASAVYLFAAIRSSRRFRPWPRSRALCWLTGQLIAAFSAVYSLSDGRFGHFAAHTVVHLLIGMLAPLMMALASPATLALRTLNVKQARRLALLLKSIPLRLAVHPVVTAALNIGGMAALYTTGLYESMCHSLLLHIVVHFHFLAAGYLFAASIVYRDPIAHRHSFAYRAAVLMLAVAAHSIAAKYVYVHPPAGVAAQDGRLGGILMYYGGDAVEIALMVLLCSERFKASRDRTLLDIQTASPE
jgi:putative membrane protein